EDSGSWVAGVWDVNTTAASFVRRPHQTLPAPATELDGSFEDLQFGFSVSDPFNRPLQDLDMNPQATGDCEASNSCTAKMLGTPRILRFGRLRLDDAFGPETVNLPVNFATEYWISTPSNPASPGFWAPSLTDSCTRIPLEKIAFDSIGSTIDTPANRTVSWSGGSTQGIFQHLQNEPTADHVLFNEGSGNLYFSAPGAQRPANSPTFPVFVNLDEIPWLRFDWNQDGNHNNDTALPPANIGFGQYRGHDRIIYWREVLEN